jgi:phosphoglycerate dehydrogenase-like enzyme
VKVALPELFRNDLDGRLPPDVGAAWYHDPASVAAAAHDADVLVIGFIDADEIRTAIDAAPRARWVSTHAAGVDHYPLDVLQARGALLTKGAGVNAAPIAEFVVLCVLSAAKGFPSLLAASQRGEWASERSPASELTGARALILGYGNIGRGVGDRLRALGMRVTGVRRTPSTDPDIIGIADWQERLHEFGYVILTAALTGQSRHLLGEAELKSMKPQAWVINVARGGLIDHDALAEALHDGRPHGVYLDVTDPEPLPRAHPLWQAPNVVITGHSAGRSERSRGRYITLFLDNLQRFQAEQPLLNLVDYSAGY